MTGVCYAGEGRVLSCGVDKTVKLWDVGHGEEVCAQAYACMHDADSRERCRSL